MKKQIFSLCIMCFLGLNTLYAQNAFTEGNLVILSVGKSGESLSASGNTVYLNEYSPDGSLVQSIPLSSSGTDKLILSGTDNYCGYLNRSADEKYLTLAGFDATVGQVSDLDASDASSVNRTIAIVDADGNIDYSTKLSKPLTYASQYTPRGVVSTDGNDLWVSAPTWQKKKVGEGGILYIQKGNTERIADINLRNYDWTNVKIYENSGNNLLFGSNSSKENGYIQVGVFLTEADYDAGTYTEIPKEYNTATSYGRTQTAVAYSELYRTDFVLLDQTSAIEGIDVAYIACRESTNGSLVKNIKTRDGVSFSSDIYFFSDNTYNYYGITEGTVSENSVVLYATRQNTSTGNYELVKITDNSGYNGNPSSATIEVLATATSGTAFRGIALAPASGKVSQTISNFINIDDKTYGDANFKLEASSTSGNPITYNIEDATIATIDTYDSVHIVGAGTTKIYASVDGNDEYKAAEATITLTVAKAYQSFVTNVSERNIEKTNNDADFYLEIPALNSGLTPYFKSTYKNVATIDQSTGLVHITGTGKTTLHVIEDGNANYKDFQIEFNLTVTNATSQTISNFEDMEKNVESTDFKLQAIASSGLAITSYTSTNTDVATITNDSIVHITGKGKTNIIAYQAGDNTYDAVKDTAILTVKYTQEIQNFNSDTTISINTNSYYLQATASSGLAVIYDVQYNSIVSVDNSNGQVEIHKAGVTEITALQSGNDDYAAAESKTITLTVSSSETPVTDVTLDKTTALLPVGAKLTLTATVSPSYAENKDVSWSSSNEAVASVDEEGVVTTIAAGSAIITVTTNDGNHTANCEITVSPSLVAVTGVTLNTNSASVTLGDSITLSATITPDNASNTDVIWSSSDETIATVDTCGKVTAIATGTSVITVTTEESSYTATCQISVTPDYSWLLEETIAIEADSAKVVGPNAADFTIFYINGTSNTGNAVNISDKSGTITLKATTSDGSEVINLIIEK